MTANPRAHRGSWAELIAAAWLNQQGAEVFFGFGNTSCDMIVIWNDQTLRVEVKAASLSRGRWVVAGVRPKLHDVLLIVLPDGTVLMNPPTTLVYQGKQTS